MIDFEVAEEFIVKLTEINDIPHVICWISSQAGKASLRNCSGPSEIAGHLRAPIYIMCRLIFEVYRLGPRNSSGKIFTVNVFIDVSKYLEVLQTDQVELEHCVIICNRIEDFTHKVQI